MFWLDRKLIIFDEVSTRGRYIPENVLNCGNHIQPFSARWLSVQLFSTLMNEIVTFVTNLKVCVKLDILDKIRCARGYYFDEYQSPLTAQQVVV